MSLELGRLSTRRTASTTVHASNPSLNITSSSQVTSYYLLLSMSVAERIELHSQRAQGSGGSVHLFAVLGIDIATGPTQE